MATGAATSSGLFSVFFFGESGDFERFVESRPCIWYGEVYELIPMKGFNYF